MTKKENIEQYNNNMSLYIRTLHGKNLSHMTIEQL